MQQQLTAAGLSSTSRSRGRRSDAELRRLHRNTSRAAHFFARWGLLGLLHSVIPGSTSSTSSRPAHIVFQPLHAGSLRRTRRNDSNAARHARPGARGLRREQHAGADLSSLFTFCHFAGTPGGARAASGRRPSPHAQPSHPFSLLSPPSFPLLPPLPRAWVWMGVVWLGREGREGSSSRSSTSLPPRAHSTLA